MAAGDSTNSPYCYPVRCYWFVLRFVALSDVERSYREDTYTAADCQAVQALVNLVVEQTERGEPSPTVTSSTVDRITGAMVPLLRQLVLLQAAHSNTIVSTLTDSYHDLAASLSLPSLSSLANLMTEASVGPGHLWYTATATWIASSGKRTWAQRLLVAMPEIVLQILYRSL